MIALRLPLLFVAFLAAVALGGCATHATPKPGIDPAAEDALKKMSDTLANTKTMTFRVESAMEEPVETGQLAQFQREVKFVLRRPDRLYVESRKGDETCMVWYRGTTLTVLNKTANTYATETVPGTVDKMLQYLEEKYGMALPLDDLLFSDPYKMLMARAVTGTLIGMHTAGGAECQHMLFTQDNMDWQIWTDCGKVPVPRKIVIDYKTQPDRPEFIATLTDFDLSTPVADDTFEPKLPEGATQVEMSELLGSR